MWLLDHTCATPAENLAMDEALLDEAEAGRSGEGLRFWESPSYFVVLGLSQAVEEHVYPDACTADGVPILRRCSAGGCVLQGPGCLNYSLVLSLDRPGCQTITASYRTILGKVASAIGSLGQPVAPAGISDLALGSLKVSGSAQRRRQCYFLHHGTFLLNFDISKCNRYLKEPSDRPEYRAERVHDAFLCNLNRTRTDVVAAVSNMFQPSKNLEFSAHNFAQAVQSLVESKYSRENWNFRR